MSGITRFRMHGVGTVVEYPNRLTGEERKGYHSAFRQKAGSFNWFHMVIPTPNKLEDDILEIFQVQLRLHPDNGIQFPALHVRSGKKLVLNVDPNINAGTEDLYEFKLDHGGSRAHTEEPFLGAYSIDAIVICLQAKWLQDNAQLRIIEAGAGYRT